MANRTGMTRATASDGTGGGRSAPGWTCLGRYDGGEGFPWSKRAFDLGLLLLFLPLLGLAAAMVYGLVRFRLGSPVLFWQERTGLKGATFRMVKFRSMTGERDAEGRLLPDDLRLGKFGRWLRASSLDELPEVWNIARGEMSWVGPRPLLPRYLARYSPEQMKRHDVPPGLTGWAQIHGRNLVTWDERFRLDGWYVANGSLGLDAWILIQTVAKVVRRDGISANGEATMAEFRGSAGSDGSGRA